MFSLLPSSVIVDRHVCAQTGYWCKKVRLSSVWCICCWCTLYSITELQFTSAGIYEKFASAFVKAVQSLQVGNGLEESTSQVQNLAMFMSCLSLSIYIPSIKMLSFHMQGPLINEDAVQKVRSLRFTILLSLVHPLLSKSAASNMFYLLDYFSLGREVCKWCYFKGNLKSSWGCAFV